MLATRLLALSIVAAAASAVTAQRYEWREVQSGVRPVGRSQHAMVYDEARRVVLLFGGRRGNPDTFLNDTWQFDGTTWTELHPTSTPPARLQHAMAYDPVRQRVVLIGGSPLGGGTAGDTWEWDGTDWTQMVSNNGSLGPNGAACYDPSLGGVFFSRGTLNMVWDGASWRYLTVVNPDAGQHIQMVYNPVLGAPIACVWDSNTRRFDLQTGWTDLYPRGSFPLYGVALACDPVSGRMVQTGGQPTSGWGVDTWVSDQADWVRLAQTIPGRSFGSMAYDSDRQRFVLFGGRKERTPSFDRDDTWELQVYDELATYATYGQGCGSPSAQLDSDPGTPSGGRPVVGRDLRMIATQLPPGQPFFHCVGRSDAAWGGLSLPFDLAPVGAPGCAVLATPEIIENVGTSGAGGDLRFTIRLPDDLRLVGARFFHQLVGLAPGLNSAGLIVTNAGAGTLGTR